MQLHQYHEYLIEYHISDSVFINTASIVSDEYFFHFWL